MKIDNSVRRYVFTTAVIQDQLIACCCDHKLQSNLIELGNIRFLRVNSPTDEPGTELFSVQARHIDLTQPIFQQSISDANAIEVEFVAEPTRPCLCLLLPNDRWRVNRRNRNLRSLIASFPFAGA